MKIMPGARLQGRVTTMLGMRQIILAGGNHPGAYAPNRSRTGTAAIAAAVTTVPMTVPSHPLAAADTGIAGDMTIMDVRRAMR